MPNETSDPLDASLSVNPAEPEGGAANAGNQERDPRQDAGQDPSIQARLERDPSNPQARLDNGLDESMDASDPITATLPGSSSTEPPASSGFDEQAEAELRSAG